ncbi:unnamed protein product [Heterobilharzia americana]|nr:unnamed protein product [Heterobilharzia americana]
MLTIPSECNLFKYTDHHVHTHLLNSPNNNHQPERQHILQYHIQHGNCLSIDQSNIEKKSLENVENEYLNKSITSISLPVDEMKYLMRRIVIVILSGYINTYTFKSLSKSK